jgi:sirohydrochlorin ferrochelatase
VSRFLLPGSLLVVLVSPLTAQRQGLLVVAHGADSGWNAGVRQVVAQVEWQGPVELVFLMGPEAERSSWNAAVTRLESQPIDSIVVVPLMVSSHGAHTRQIQHYAGQLAELPAALAGHAHAHVERPRLPVRVTAALDAAPELGQVLLARWQERDSADRRRPVVLVAHGPTTDDDARAWETALLRANAPLYQALDGLPLQVGLLRDDAPPAERARAVSAIRDTIAALSQRHGDSVLVMTVLISSGGINRVKVPNDLAGTPMRYAGVVLAPHPQLARWIERVAGGK